MNVIPQSAAGRFPRQDGQATRSQQPVNIALDRLESIVDDSGVALRIEARLPVGVRPRQLRVRTLLIAMMLTQADHRPAHLTRVHTALTALPTADQWRLGVITDWKHCPHQLTYRQTERTFALMVAALAKPEPDGSPSQLLTEILDDLLEASIPPEHKQASGSLAVDWTNLETFSRPPSRGSSDCADPEASWEHRNSNLPGPKGELFFGYYLSAATSRVSVAVCLRRVASSNIADRDHIVEPGASQQLKPLRGGD